MIIMFLFACISEYSMDNLCISQDEFIFCSMEKNYDDAVNYCNQLGYELIDTSTDPDMMDVDRAARIISLAQLNLTQDTWWSALQLYDDVGPYTCTAQTSEVWHPIPCGSQHYFICE